MALVAASPTTAMDSYYLKTTNILTREQEEQSGWRNSDRNLLQVSSRGHLLARPSIA